MNKHVNKVRKATGRANRLTVVLTGVPWYTTACQTVGTIIYHSTLDTILSHHGIPNAFQMETIMAIQPTLCYHDSVGLYWLLVQFMQW